MALMNGNSFGLIPRESYVECLSPLDQSHWRQFFKRERERSDEGNLKASHWSCGCLNTYHPRFECPSMSESERAEHKARALGCSTVGDSLYEECLATQDPPAASSVGSGDQEAARLFGSAVYHQDHWRQMLERQRLVESDAYQATQCIGTDDPTDIVPLKKGDIGSVYGDESRDSVIEFDETMTRAMVAAGYVAMRDSTELNDDEAAVVVYRAMRALEPEAKPEKGDDPALLGTLVSHTRTIAVLREGIDKANAEIMRLRDELARRPAAFVEPEPDKPNPFRDFTTERRRMGPL